MGFRNAFNGIPPSSITDDMLADGSVTGSKLSADAIDGKTITGAFIRTAATGRRWELSSTPSNELRAFTGLEGATPNSVHGYLTVDYADSGLGAPESESYVELLPPRVGNLYPYQSGLRLGAPNTRDAYADLWAEELHLTGGPQAFGPNTSTADLTSGSIALDAANVLLSRLGVNCLNIGGGLLRSPAVNTLTTTAASNVFINPTAHNFARSTSMRAAKLAIEPVALADAEALLGLDVVTWFDRTAAESYAASIETADDDERARLREDMAVGLRRIPGLVAEDVADTAPLFATYDSDGDLTGVAYDRVGVAWIPLVRTLVERVELLEARLTTLGG